ncbi:hypothetical protein G7Y89_g8043 [Cudoniella acicularis]|uniref:Rhodopsin domain-containing protein n=1 Tax=Cudoniella acicularis TaxID=354080 RepID=A0A8H4RKY0_9HELO|nr:hypothetical protein G7Y89_g8043 [Cudoniella acicularis]
MPNIPTASELAYYEAHPNDNLVPDILACCSICSVASAIFILFRLWARRLVYGRLHVNATDWLLIIAWVFYIVFDVCFALTTKYGGGRHIIYITDAKILQILNLADENTYCFAMAFIKLSILKMYGDIFISKRFHYCLWAVAVFMIAWATAFSLTAIFQCTPIAFNWDITITDGFCINYGAVVMAAGAFNIATDLTILVMPIPMVLRLHTSKQKKWQVIFAFALGSSACIISIVRLGFASKVGTTADGSWDDIPAGLASTAELMTGILAASIPTYRPLYLHLVYGSATGKTQVGSSGRNRYGPNSSNKNPSLGVKIFSGDNSSPSKEGSGINVTSEVEMTVYNNIASADPNAHSKPNPSILAHLVLTRKNHGYPENIGVQPDWDLVANLLGHNDRTCRQAAVIHLLAHLIFLNITLDHNIGPVDSIFYRQTWLHFHKKHSLLKKPVTKLISGTSGLGKKAAPIYDIAKSGNTIKILTCIKNDLPLTSVVVITSLDLARDV